MTTPKNHKPFSAWRVGFPYYAPLLLVGAVIIAFTWHTVYWIPGAVALLAGVFALFFFRDPHRRIPTDPDAIVSPADGTVVGIEDFAETPHYPGPCRRIAIFLSVFNVHVNRAPVDCTVNDVVYKRGKYVNAMRGDSSELNESNTFLLEGAQGAMTVRQISGAVARRIVSLPAPGEKLSKGDRIGMIKFGSRTELYLPPDTQVCVKIKDKVKGGSTIVARRPPR